MAEPPGAGQPRGMRDAENELYDRGCDLVEAAAGLRHAAGPESRVAVPAVLGCVESALADLRLAGAALLLAVGPGADPRDTARAAAWRPSPRRSTTPRSRPAPPARWPPAAISHRHR